MAPRKKAKVAPLHKKTVSELTADVLRDYIERNRAQLEKLPAISELARQLKVSVVSAHKAVSQLAAEGVVEVHHGKGVFIGKAIGDLASEPTRPGILLVHPAGLPLTHMSGQDPFYPSIVRGLMTQVERAGYRLSAYAVSNDDARDPDAWPGIVKACEYRRAVGIVLLAIVEQDLLAWIARDCPPHVLVDHWSERAPMDSVNPDNHGSVHRATTHLIGLGRRDVAFLVHRRPETNPPRVQGYRDALSEAGIPYRKALFVPTYVSEHGGELAVDSLFDADVPFDGLVCYSGGLARGAITALAKRGKTAPRDVSVIALASDAASVPAAVEWVDLQPLEIGETAARRMIERIGNPRMKPQDLVAPAVLRAAGRGQGREG